MFSKFILSRISVLNQQPLTLRCKKFTMESVFEQRLGSIVEGGDVEVIVTACNWRRLANPRG